MLTAIIVDDDPVCCESLLTQIEWYCPDIRILDVCYSGNAALSSIYTFRPNLVFLDHDMPNMNGFEMLKQLPRTDFDLIFVISYDRFAIKAIMASALDYILKPVDGEELENKVQKVLHREVHASEDQIECLLKELGKSEKE